MVFIMPLLTIFKLYHGGGNWMEYPEKTTDLPQVTDKLYHIKLNRVHLVTSWILTSNVSGDKH